MARALALAGRGWGRVHPNPLVGAVVVRDEAIVGSGWHAEYGGAHAEVVALGEAGARARGAELFVTLEPCAHHGKTPPCTDAILEAGIRRVVFAAADPTARAGGGAARLRAAGLEVVEGVSRAEARAQNRAFFHIHEQGAPFVTLKLALSMDARIGGPGAAPVRLTGPAANDDVHRLRAGADAILIGSRTARADDPLLTARGSVRPRIPPVRVVLDSHAALPATSRMLRDGVAPVWVMCRPDAEPARRAALEAAGARILPVAGAPGGLDLDGMFGALRDNGVGTILCEGGGRLAAALLEADRVDRLVLYLAPVWLGPDAVPAFPLRQAPAGLWRTARTTVLEADIRIVLDRVRGKAE